MKPSIDKATPELELWIEPESNRYHKGPDTEYAKAQGWIQVVRQDIADDRVKLLREAGEAALKELNFLLSDPDRRGGLYEAARDKLRAVLKEAE